MEPYSINTGEIRTFGTVDYVLFCLILALSAVIGMYYAFRDRKQVTSRNFMVASQGMYVVPVAMSLAVTFLSALSLLGNPVEIYNFNTMFWYLVLALLLAVAACAHIFVPFFYRLKVTTVFEYLQMRFNTPVRVLGSIILILQTLTYFSFILYAPALALSSVTNLSLWGSVLGMGLLVTFYTTLGGMKAVVWTDTLQAAIILAGFLATLIQGSIVAGGFEKAWKIAEARDRIRFDDFNVDPSTRHSFWSVVVGGGFFWMSLYGVNQAQVQRCLSCRTVKKAQIALWVNLPAIVIITSLCFMIGVVMFAFYSECHPKGIITKNDQLLPLFVMDILSDFQGLPGVFVAGIFSGSLSSLSSGLNSISAVTMKDLFVPYCCPRLSDFKTTLVTKLLVVIFGGIGMAFAYLVGNLDRVLQASYSVYSILNGPLFGLFLLGMFFPWANSFGAFVGAIVSLVFMAWIGFGAIHYGVSTAKRSNVTTLGCVWSNITTNITTTTASTITTLANATTAAPADPTDIPAYGIYTLSYLYYTITGAAVVVIVGLIFSFITGYTRPSTLDPRLICPLFDHVFPCLPDSVLRPFRCGIDHTDKYEKHDKAILEFEATLTEEIKVTLDGKGDPEKTQSSAVPATNGKAYDNDAFVSDGKLSSPEEWNTRL
ncbi:sodium-coupled monocarboxylate transporter 1-like [Littorina saxatilis]|uniref:Sodium-coupled monocarboxylate transporter 2 n=1 Tax=Littorina saxatilis TaxID=31220 RepID=A0AAN9BXL1_9CAEN